jgi:hypothetical protein
MWLAFKRRFYPFLNQSPLTASEARQAAQVIRIGARDIVGIYLLIDRANPRDLKPPAEKRASHGILERTRVCIPRHMLFNPHPFQQHSGGATRAIVAS